MPIALRWERELAQAGRFSDRGRPSLAMETYVRLMALKHRCGWGYEALMREVSELDSSAAFLPAGADRAGARRVDGAQVDAPAGARGGAPALARVDREGAAGEAVSSAGGADRLDRGRGRHSVSDRFRAGGRRRPGAGAGGAQAGGQDRRQAHRGQDRSRAAGRRLRGITRTMRHRSGQAKEDVLKLTRQTGELLARSVKEARRLAAEARRRARGAAPRPSSRPRVSSSSWPTAARRSSSRSPSASRARRSPTG